MNLNSAIQRWVEEMTELKKTYRCNITDESVKGAVLLAGVFTN